MEIGGFVGYNIEEIYIMGAKCPKCESMDFSIVKREDKLFCYVACKKCGTVVGVLEDVDFKERYKTIIEN